MAYPITVTVPIGIPMRIHPVVVVVDVFASDIVGLRVLAIPRPAAEEDWAKSVPLLSLPFAFRPLRVPVPAKLVEADLYTVPDTATAAAVAVAASVTEVEGEESFD